MEDNVQWRNQNTVQDASDRITFLENAYKLIEGDVAKCRFCAHVDWIDDMPQMGCESDSYVCRHCMYAHGKRCEACNESWRSDGWINTTTYLSNYEDMHWEPEGNGDA